MNEKKCLLKMCSMLISQVQDVGPLAITSYCDMFTLVYLLHVNSDISKQCFENLCFC